MWLPRVVVFALSNLVKRTCGSTVLQIVSTFNNSITFATLGVAGAIGRGLDQRDKRTPEMGWPYGLIVLLTIWETT